MTSNRSLVTPAGTVYVGPAQLASVLRGNLTCPRGVAGATGLALPSATPTGLRKLPPEAIVVTVLATTSTRKTAPAPPAASGSATSSVRFVSATIPDGLPNFPPETIVLRTRVSGLIETTPPAPLLRSGSTT